MTWQINIHPLVVHFPIALLLVYSALEVIGFQHRVTKVTMLYLGTLAGYAAIIAGFIAKSLIQNEEVRILVGKHEWMAISSIAIFTIAALMYWMQKETRLVKVLAVLGAIGLLITGGLGGSIVYGPSNDPVTNWIYNLFN
jgi:uncharacterized membrane protein